MLSRKQHTTVVQFYRLNCTNWLRTRCSTIYFCKSLCVYFITQFTVHQLEFSTRSYSNSRTMTPICQKVQLLSFHLLFNHILYKTLLNIKEQHTTHFKHDFYFPHQIYPFIINKIQFYHHNTQEYQ